MRIRTSLLVACLACSAAAQYPGAKPAPQSWRKGFDSIREQDAREILSYLAGKELRGRGSLSPDYWAAAGYVANELRKMGLEPAGENGTYFQRFDYVRSATVPAETYLQSGEFKLEYGPDFQVSHESDVDAKVRFAFVNVPEKGELAEIDWDALKGRVVVYASTAMRNPAFAAKIGVGRESLGVEQLVSVGRNALPTREPTRATGLKDLPDPRETQVGAIRLSPAGAKKIAEFVGASKFSTETPAQASVELPSQEFGIRLKVQQEVTPLVNVIGKLPGSDREMAKEAVVFGSHLDHVGPANDGIRYGADDNASGCTANLMIAKAMLANPTKPKRSVLFCFWAAEEVGTFGSLAYALKPAHPHADTIAYINMDMLGRDEETGAEIAENNRNVVYPGTVLTTSRDFYDRLVENNAYVGLRFKPDKTDRTHRSDTRNFVWKNVPTVKVFTGEHPDYHRAGDTIDKINWTKLVNIAKWLYLTASDLASRPGRPAWDPKPFVAPDHVVLAGRATFKERIAIPAKAVLRVKLVEAGSSGPIAQKDFPNSQGRTPFELLVPKSLLKDGVKYELLFEIVDGSRSIFQNEAPVAVPATGWARATEVPLKAVSN